MPALGVHVLDNLQYLAGPIAELYVRSKRLLEGSELDDGTAIVMELEGGPARLLGGRCSSSPKTMTTVAFGTDAIAWIDEDSQGFFVQGKGDWVAGRSHSIPSMFSAPRW